MMSIIANAAENDRLHFHVLDTGMKPDALEALRSIASKSDRCDLELTPFDMSLLEPYRVAFNTSPRHLSITCLARLFIPYVYPNVDKMLYIDGDTITRTSLRDLYMMDINGFYFAGACDSGMKYWTPGQNYIQSQGISLEKYINSGVLLMNSRAMRHDDYLKGITEQLIPILQHAPCRDQDIINTIWGEKILHIPQKYNMGPRDGIQEDTIIVHYYGRDKPWKVRQESERFDEWVKYASMTGLYDDYLGIASKKEEVETSSSEKKH